MPELIPLHLLLPGQIGEIDQLFGPPDQVHRLEELGLRRGAQVEMVQSGTPCMIRLGGSTLGLRGGDCLNVLVRAGVTV